MFMLYPPVHPHVCGEHVPLLPPIFIYNGSSPRVWGTYISVNNRVFCVRFIPTCVGNIFGVTGIAKDEAVHPHVCGEHLDGVPDATNKDGSSPRVWGTYPLPICYRPGIRFIPTCVGNISKRLTTCEQRTVHPHVCGEHLFIHDDRAITGGSSPRVWGTLSEMEEKSRWSRFIPTCVGNIPSGLFSGWQ